MEKIQYNKLVRDKIPNIIKKSGGKCKVKRLTSDGLIAELCKKPKEEYEEYCKAKTSEERLGELADIIYPVLCLQRHLSLSSLALKTHRANFRGVSTTRKYLTLKKSWESILVAYMVVTLTSKSPRS